jgi:hypothetical protein
LSGFKAKVFLDLASYFVRAGAGQRALEVLKELTTDFCFDPTPTMCQPVMEAALFSGDARGESIT